MMKIIKLSLKIIYVCACFCISDIIKCVEAKNALLAVRHNITYAAIVSIESHFT